MKERNIQLMKEALMDEFGINEELATFTAKTAIESVGRALIAFADKVAKTPQEEET